MGYKEKTRRTLIMRFNRSKYDKVSSFKFAKEIWEVLETYNEEFKSLRKVKLSALVNELENFKLKEGESIKETQARFQNTINRLQKLYKKITQEKINMKVL